MRFGKLIEVFEDAIVDMYKKMFKKYFEERKLIPEENLVEVRYEEFIASPLHGMNIQKTGLIWV